MRQYMIDDHNLFPYTIEVERDNQRELGPGILKAKYKEEILEEFTVITGGKTLNSTNYGGITPPITWMPVEPFVERSPDGNRPTMRMSRIVPVYRSYANLFYPKRTFALPPERNDPFMIHLGEATLGASTGCIVVTEKKEKFFSLFYEMQMQSKVFVPIHVRNYEEEG